MHSSANMLQTVVIAMAAGTLLLVIAGRLRIPAIAPLLVGGVLLGPEGLGLVRPTSLGDGLEPFVSLAVAVILFEGGLSLDVHGARAAPRVIWRLVSVGALITWLGSAGLTMLLLDLSLPTALLAGSLIIVTGPTVVTPLLRRIGVCERVHHVLHWEAVLIDPIGVFVALLCYEWVLLESTVAAAVVELALRIAVGTVLGIGGGLLFGQLLKRRVIGREYANIAVLAGALLLYGLGDRALPHTGILAVTIAGFVLGWLKPAALEEIKTFKLQMTELAVAMVFLVLAADLELGSFYELGAQGALVVALVILLIRPLVVLVSTWKATLSLRERLFVAWIAPRGIVAASMASLFTLQLTQTGHTESAIVEPLTFAVIAATVLLQGSTAGMVARLLGVRRPERTGWLIVNARPLGQRLARLLNADGVRTILVDRNARVVAEAQRQGLEALLADGLDMELPADPRLVDVGNILCATDNDGVNAALAARWSPELGDEHVFVWGQVCTGARLGQQPSALPREDVLSRTARVNRGLAAEELEILTLAPDQGDLPPGIRPLFALRDGKAAVITSPKVRQEHRRIVLQWTRPAEHELFQAAVFPSPRPESLEAAYRRLVQKAGEHLELLDVEAVTTGIIERERTMSMVFDNGVAIPNSIAPGVKRPVCVIGIVRDGVSQPQPDRASIYVLFLLLSPPGAAEAHLQAMATLAHWAHDAKRVDSLVSASSPEEAVARMVGYVRRRRET